MTLDVPDDAARKPRSAEDMAAEAARYRRRGEPFPEPANVTFGPFAVDASQVFFESATCRALVNLKPLVAGHVLVVPKAVVPTLGEMDEELHRDLWRAARRVHAMITEEYGATGANVAVQDGIAAGQACPTRTCTRAGALSTLQTLHTTQSDVAAKTNDAQRRAATRSSASCWIRASTNRRSPRRARAARRGSSRGSSGQSPA